MNKHNSVTSTYYLLLKHRKRELVGEMEKQGKNGDNIVRNEKQQLMNLLKDFGATSKPKNTSKQAVQVNQNNENKTKVTNADSKVTHESGDIKSKNAKDQAEVVENKFDKSVLKPISIPEDSIEPNDLSVKSKTVDLSVKLKKRHESVDKQSKKTVPEVDIKRIPRHETKPAFEEDPDGKEGTVIMSSRQHNQNISPSPSPEKYDIEPSREKKSVGIEPKPVKKTNYYSATNKKAKKYDYHNFEVNNSMRHKAHPESGGNCNSENNANKSIDSGIHIHNHTKTDSQSKVSM